VIARRQLILSGLLTALALLAAATWWQVFGVTFGKVVLALNGFKGRWLALVFLALMVQIALSAIRWATIEAAIGGHRPSFQLGFVSGAIAIALGTVMPAPMMSVLCRSVATRITGNGARRGAISGLLDQGCDLAICVWFAIPALVVILTGDLPRFPMFALASGLVGWLLALGTGWAVPRLVSAHLIRRYDWLMRLATPRAVSVLYLTSVMRAGNLLVMALLISLTSAAIDPLALAIAVPIVAVANALAMLPGAIGVSEWGYSSILAEIGVAEGAIITFLLSNRAILTGLPVLLGLVVAAVCGLRRWWLGAPRGRIAA
jgi:uncharacterized membrane protein YbhN (UPF0104 family)